MIVFNQVNRVPSTGSNPPVPGSQLAMRVRHYFDQHPEVAREEFLLDAVRREILFREQKKTTSGTRSVRPEGDGASPRPATWPTLSNEDIRIHARLAEHVAAVHHERHGLWPKIRRFFFSNRPLSSVPETRQIYVKPSSRQIILPQPGASPTSTVSNQQMADRSPQNRKN